MARDAIRFVDRHHLGVLGHSCLEVEFDAGVDLVVQCPHCDRSGIDPTIILGRPEEHVLQWSIIVLDSPAARFINQVN